MIKKYCKLQEVVNITPSKKQLSNNVWLLNLDMIEQQSGKIIQYHFVEKNSINSSTIQFDTDTVLYSKLRPNLNKVVLPDKDGYATSEILPLKPDLSVLTKEYLVYFLRSSYFVNYICTKVSGAKMPRASRKELLNSIIPLPPLDEQKRIAAILDKATELIALRKQQLEKLDLLVKSRFIEMFGTLPNKDYVFLEEMCVLITDGTHQPPKFVKEGIPFLFVSNIVKNTITYDTEKYITEENYIELIKRTPVEIGDILFSTVGSYGHPAVVKYDRPFCFQRHIAYLKPKKELVNSDYLHSALLSVDGQRQIEARVKGVAQKTLNLSEIRNIRLPLPSMKQQLNFASFIQKVDKTKSTLQQSLEKLELNYKALMQTYFG